jgi:crotonobetainyl-CoA:carnitine CoA-transferase CaiB-like acyl-CoA transferase
LLGRDDWLADPRYATQASRQQHAAAINAEVAAIMADGRCDDWLQRLHGADVLFSAIHTHADLLADAQMQHMGYTVQVQQPPYGTLTLPQLPGRPDAPTPAPLCGEHSVQVLRRCGVDEARIGALLASGVVLQANLNATDPRGP